MSLPTASPRAHRLFDRTWRRTCPIRPRHGRLRRWGRSVLLLACIALLGGYTLLTDDRRVRDQAERYLERLVGGEVEIRSASLGVFDGLRLTGVRVRTPGTDPDDPAATVFTARSVTIDYDPLSLLAGDLTAGRVVATDPHVRLVEDVADGRFNAQDLGLFGRRGGGGRPFRPPAQLPSLVLRNARVEYARRAGPTLVPRGAVTLEAQFAPRPDGPDGDGAAGAGGGTPYAFAVQTSQGGGAADAGLGPRARGSVRLGGGPDGRGASVTAELWDVDFAKLRALLPGRAADWARRHGVAGRIAVPRVAYDFDPDRPAGERGRLALDVRLDGGAFRGLPEQWLPAQEVETRRALTHLAARAADAAWLPAPVRSAAARLAEAGPLRPLELRDVSGLFRLTDDGVRVSGLTGELAGNRLRINGVVDGYGRDAALLLNVRSDGELAVPDRLDYLASLPRPVREVYARFRPAGRARLDLTLARDAGGGRPVVTGRVDVLGGTFALDRLPYPVHRARGRLRLSHRDGADRLTIEDLRGTGPPNTPNADARLVVNGTVEPLDSAAGFDVRVVGRDLRHTPDLVAALPPEVRRVVDAFDPTLADPDATLPRVGFAGDFEARVTRPPGRGERWSFAVDLDARELSGSLAAFPYPLRDATARVRVRDDRATIERATMRRGEAEFSLSGRVEWGRDPDADDPAAPPPLRYAIELRGTDAEADAALLAALPAEAAGQLASLGVGGRGDVAATVTRTRGGLDWRASVDVADGRFWPAGGLFSLDELTGRVQLSPGRAELLNLAGRRGEGRVAVDGSVEFAGESDLTVAARSLPLDVATYDLLPAEARDAWDWLRPAGAADADLVVRGPTALLAGGESDGELDYDVVLRPRGVTATPAGFPYDLRNVAGTIRVTPGRVEVEGLTAEHAVEGRGPATIALSGAGDLTVADAPAGAWDLSASLSDAPVDADLLAALPAAVADALRGAGFAGVVSADLGVLKIRTNRPIGDAESAPDVKFSGTLRAADAAFDLGVPVTAFDGRIEVAGTYELGRLYELSGDVAADSFALSGRPGRDLKAAFALPPGGETLAVDELAATVAGGLLDARATLALAREADDAAAFRVTASLANVDLAQLVPGDVGSGRLTAGLELRGVAGDPASREGRGSLFVRGDRLYDLPLVLGLLQVTNLALPIAEPFREAEARFTMDGSRVDFESLELRGAPRGPGGGPMRLAGGGWLDFESGRIRLVINTSNRGWDRIPLVGDLVGVVRNELVGVAVEGTLAEPEVSGTTLRTVRGTFDRVLGKADAGG